VNPAAGIKAIHDPSAADWVLQPSCLLFTSLFVFGQNRSNEGADEPKASGKGLEHFSMRGLSICLIGPTTLQFLPITV
jgi:hypothetical protein